MARPKRDGVDYWPFDTALFEDKKIKLIKGEFGIKGVYIALLAINEIYRTGGYYKVWDDDDCFLMSEGVGCGCTPTLVTEVIHRCCERSLFHKGVFDVFGVLTSTGIQRRWLRMVAKNRDSIPIIQEYWLLDVGDDNDVPTGTLNKLTFKKVTPSDNPVNRADNSVNCAGKATNQNKSNQSKVNQIKSPPLQSEREPEGSQQAEMIDDDEMIKKIESHILSRRATAQERSEITDLLTEYTESSVESAISRTYECGGRSISYLRKVLESCSEHSDTSCGMYAPTHEISEIEALMESEFWEDGDLE